MPESTDIPQALIEMLDYDSITGDFTWKSDGAVAGSNAGRGYLKIGHRGRKYYCHRLAWEMTYGAIPDGMLIDHIDGNKSDNSIANLRLATKSQNGCNSKLNSKNKCGLKGVSWFPPMKAWAVEIRIGDKRLRLGYYPSKYMAHNAYRFAAGIVHKEFARHV